MISWYNAGVINRKVDHGATGIARGLSPEKELLMNPNDTLSAPVVKTCTKCGESKPATTEYFFADKKGKGGLHASCKACRKEYSRSYYESNREYKLAYYHANKNRFLVRTRAFWHKNKWREAQKNKAYRSANKERIAKRMQAYQRSNPERMRARSAQRRAIQRSAAGTYTEADVRRQYSAQKGKCYYCGIDVGKAYHVDHVVPLSRGGSNDRSNLVIACQNCNQSKHNKLPHEWPEGGRLL